MKKIKKLNWVEMSKAQYGERTEEALKVFFQDTIDKINEIIEVINAPKKEN
jgi:hypothetical protein